MLRFSGQAYFRKFNSIISVRCCSSPLSKYNSLVKEKQIKDDAHQRSIITYLEDLHSKCKPYNPDNLQTQKVQKEKSKGFFSVSLH